MEAKDFGLVRGTQPLIMAGDRRMEVNGQGDQMCSNVLPERAQIVNAGASWIKRSDEVACVTAIPTTTAPHTFWNGNQTKACIIDYIAWQCTTSAAAASMFSLLGLVNTVGFPLIPSTGDTATAIIGLSGKVYNGNVKSSHAVTVVDDGWFPLGGTIHSGALTATAGMTLDARINGLVVVPPLGVFSVAVIAVNTTAKGKLAIAWHEISSSLIA